MQYNLKQPNRFLTLIHETSNKLRDLLNGSSEGNWYIDIDDETLVTPHLQLINALNTIRTEDEVSEASQERILGRLAQQSLLDYYPLPSNQETFQVDGQTLDLIDYTTWVIYTYEYDDEGNLLSIPILTKPKGLGWNAFGELADVVDDLLHYVQPLMFFLSIARTWQQAEANGIAFDAVVEHNDFTRTLEIKKAVETGELSKALVHWDRLLEFGKMKIDD